MCVLCSDGGVETTIRSERPEDAAAIRAVVARAFEAAPMKAPSIEADGAPGEATLVGWLRDSPVYEPRLTFVAETADAVVGFVMSTWGAVDGRPLLGVGPLAVDPHVQGQGVGAALMNQTVRVAREMGEAAMVLLGDPAYYSRFGFVPARELGIGADPAWGDYFQAVALNNGAHGVIPTGAFRYAEPFGRLG